MELPLKCPNPSSKSDCEAGLPANYFDYSQRAQWLRAIVLGGNEGLVSSTIFVMGMGSVIKETKDLMVMGLSGLLAGALTIFTSEFVSIYTQVDIVDSQNDRDQRNGTVGQNAKAPKPTQIAVAASVAYLVGGVVPILVALVVGDLKMRFCAAAVSASLAMFVVGNIGASLGKAPVVRSCARVVMGGWIEIAIMIGKLKFHEYYGV